MKLIRHGMLASLLIFLWPVAPVEASEREKPWSHQDVEDLQPSVEAQGQGAAEEAPEAEGRKWRPFIGMGFISGSLEQQKAAIEGLGRGFGLQLGADVLYKFLSFSGDFSFQRHSDETRKS